MMLLRLVIMENHNIECLLYSLNPKKKNRGSGIVMQMCKRKISLKRPSEERLQYIYIFI